MGRPRSYTPEMLATATAMRLRGHSLNVIGAVIGKSGNHVSLILRQAGVQHPGGSVRGLSLEQIVTTTRMWREGEIFRVIALATGRNTETISGWCRANIATIGPRGPRVLKRNPRVRKVRIEKSRLRAVKAKAKAKAKAKVKAAAKRVQKPVAPAVQRIMPFIASCLPVAALYRAPPAVPPRVALTSGQQEQRRRCEATFISADAHARLCRRCMTSAPVPFELSDDGRRVAFHG